MRHDLKILVDDDGIDQLRAELQAAYLAALDREARRG